MRQGRARQETVKANGRTDVGAVVGAAVGADVGVGVGVERLTDHFNRVADDPFVAEGVRLAAMREAVAAVLMREKGGLAGRADAWVDRPQLTCLVQDVWLKLESGGPWQSRAHFLGAVARAARQVLIDQARKRQRRHAHAPMNGAADADERASGHIELTSAQADRLLDIERLLHELAAEGSPNSERAARVASLRLFGGLPCRLIAEAEGVSTRAVERDWAYARAWLANGLANRLANRLERSSPAGEP